MRKIFSRLTALTLVILLIAGMMSITAVAAEEDSPVVTNRNKDKTLSVGSTYTILTPLVDNYTPPSGSSLKWTWTSGNPSIASVSGKVVTAVSAGVVTITGKPSDPILPSQTFKVTVTGDAYFTCSSISIPAGGSDLLEPTFFGLPTGASITTTFTASSPKLIVAQDGTVSGSTPGVYSVTVSAYYVPSGKADTAANRVTLDPVTVYVSVYGEHVVDVRLKNDTPNTFTFTDENLFSSAKYDNSPVSGSSSLQYLLSEDGAYSIEFHEPADSDTIGEWYTNSTAQTKAVCLISDLNLASVTLNGMPGTLILNYITKSDAVTGNLIVSTGVLKITPGQLAPNILYKTSLNTNVTVNKADFNNFFETAKAAGRVTGNLSYVTFDVSDTAPEQGSLYTRTPVAVTKDLVSPVQKFSYDNSGSGYDLGTVTYVPNAQADSPYVDAVGFVCHSTTGSTVSGILGFDTSFKRIYVKDTVVAPGATFSVPVCIDENAGFSGFVFTHSFDDSVLTLTDVQPGNVLTASSSGSLVFNPDTCTVAWEDSKNVTGTGTLYTLHFQVSKYAMQGSHTVKIQLKNDNPNNFVNAAMEPVAPFFGYGTVSVSGSILGDLNADGKITALDAVMLAQARIGLLNLTAAQKKAADLDSDNTLTSSDSVLMARLLVGLPLEPISMFSLKTTADAPAAALSTGSAAARTGDIVTLPVMLNTDQRISGFTFSVDYDQAALELTDIRPGDLLSAAGGSFELNLKQNSVTWTKLQGMQGSGQLLELTFRVLDGAKAGETAVQVSLLDGQNKNCVDSFAMAIPLLSERGIITISRMAELLGTIHGTLNTPAEQPAIPFGDVAKGDWFLEEVTYVYEKGLMNGVSANRFFPDGQVTRAMAVQVLYNLEKPADQCENTFSDVADDDWFCAAVSWAAKHQIVLGYGDGTFGPNDAVTREQLAAILFRYAQYRGLEAVTMAEHLLGFADEAEVSSYAVPALNWAVGLGIVTGRTETTLIPQGTATRAELAAMLMRFAETAVS